MRAPTPQPEDKRKTNKDHAPKLKGTDLKNVKKNGLLFLICATKLLAGSGPNNARPHKTQPRKSETQSNTAEEKVGLKLRETFDFQIITRTLKKSPRIRVLIESSQPGNSNVCNVCRDFTAARCVQQTDQRHMVLADSQKVRVTLKDTCMGRHIAIDA